MKYYNIIYRDGHYTNDLVLSKVLDLIKINKDFSEIVFYPIGDDYKEQNRVMQDIFNRNMNNITIMINKAMYNSNRKFLKEAMFKTVIIEITF